MPRVPTIQIQSVVKIIDAATAAGVNPAQLYRAAQLDPALLNDPDNRIPYAQVIALYEHAARLTGDDDFGLRVAERANPTLFDVLGYVVLHSPTFGAALERIVRYHAIWNDGASFNFIVRDGAAHLAYDYADELKGPRRHDCEVTLALVVLFARQVTGTDWRPRAVSFQHAEPADITEHQRIFRAPLRFAQPRNEIVFDRAALALPLAKADAALCAVLDRHAAELLARLPQTDDARAQVRRLLSASLHDGEPSLARVARQLGTSARTLQRKLSAEGTSFQDVLDETRRDLAQHYLRERALAVCEIAYLLGFSEPSAFHRAFRRWTGLTPKEFRQTKT